MVASYTATKLSRFWKQLAFWSFWASHFRARVDTPTHTKKHLGPCLNQEDRATELRAVLFELDPTGSQAKKVYWRGCLNWKKRGRQGQASGASGATLCVFTGAEGLHSTWHRAWMVFMRSPETPAFSSSFSSSGTRRRRPPLSAA